MIGEQSVLAIVPARGGSKGVPRKNLRDLAGRPLLQWTADAARQSRYIDRAVLSTDDREIAGLGQAVGLDVPFLRPAQLATDAATAASVVLHCLAALDRRYDVLVYLQPTSPLRAPRDIDACVELVAAGHDFVVSVQEAAERPEWMYYLSPDQTLSPLVETASDARRQELRSCFVLNGAVYAANVAAYERSRTFLTTESAGYVMPRERSVDIDEELDFVIATALVSAAGGDAAV